MLRLASTVCVVVLLSAGCAFAQPGLIEPDAGTWKTWVIPSGKDFRVPPPPDASATAAELVEVQKLVGQADGGIAARIRFWDAGSPGYRWID